MAGDVRYRVKADNFVLRSVLHSAWDYKCYWCGHLKDVIDVQIDHIVPQAATAERLHHLAVQFNLPADFNVHDPRNLAPICSSCNGPGGKGGEDLNDLPVMFTKLKKAANLRSKIIKEVQEFADPSKVASDLIQANEADLSNPATRRAFETFAPAVVQKLALLDESKIDFVSSKTVAVLVDKNYHDPELVVGMFLRSNGRRTAAILEDVCEGVIEDLIQEPVAEIIQQIYDRAQSDFEHGWVHSKEIDYQVEPITAGPPVSDFTRVDIDSLDLNRDGPIFEFIFGGEFEASMSASLAQYSADGSELVEQQGDAFVMGRYSFVATWDISEGGDIHTGDCSIESWDFMK